MVTVYARNPLRMGPDMSVCVLLVLATLSSVDGGKNMSRPRWEEECSEPCSGEQCDRLKALLNKEVDTDLDPCEDFYQFACGASTGPPKVEHMDSFLDLVRGNLVRQSYSCASPCADGTPGQEPGVGVPLGVTVT